MYNDVIIALSTYCVDVSVIGCLGEKVHVMRSSSEHAVMHEVPRRMIMRGLNDGGK